MTSEFIRFCFIGGLATGLYVASYFVALLISGHIPFATGFAFFVSLAFSFIFQSLFTFRVQKMQRRHMLRYIIVVVVITSSLTLGSYYAAPQLGEWGWLIVVVVAFPVLSYLGHKYFTYSGLNEERY